jgi:hypothetical protein
MRIGEQGDTYKCNNEGLTTNGVLIKAMHFFELALNIRVR